MKSKILIVSFAVCFVMSAMAFAGNGCYDCDACDPCNTCTSCCTQKCDLFGGLKKLLTVKPHRGGCGPCDSVMACSPCEAACEPVACSPCEPVGCYDACVAPCDPCDAGCYDPCCNPCDRPLLNAAHKTKKNVSRFFSGLFGSLKGCNCNLCKGNGCNACAPCEVACDPCQPARFGGGYNYAEPAAIPAPPQN